MARTPIHDRPAISQWLIHARASRGDTYTAEDFIEELRAANGSAPHPATYRQWESGAVTPKEASLAPVFAFWAERGIEPPTEPTVPVLSLEERAVLAAEAQVEATRENTAMLAAVLAQLTGQPLVEPPAPAAIQAQAAAGGHTSRLPQSDPTQGTTGR